MPVADRQQVAIARALLHNARLIIMDEPTTALTQREIDNLFAIVAELQRDDISILFVSHKLREVMQICQTITIMRNGEVVADGNVSDFDEKSIARHMTGREISGGKRHFIPDPGLSPLLRVEGLKSGSDLDNISFSLFPGEILGITGLLGSGRNELALALFGVYPVDSGRIILDGQTLRLGSMADAVRNGIGYIPEDRLMQGLFLNKPLSDNFSSTILDVYKNSLGFLKTGELRRLADELIHLLRISAPSADVPAMTLSGGNQQRVVIGKWLARKPKLLILNGPTVGVDVGSKQEIHARLRELADRGMGIIIISDDLTELVENCGRTLLIHKGGIVREFSGTGHSDVCISEEISRL